MEVLNATPRPLYPGKLPGTHCIGGWVGLRESLSGCGKYRPHRNSIPGLSSQLTSRYKKQKCAAHLKYWANRRSIKKNPTYLKIETHVMISAWSWVLREVSAGQHCLHLLWNPREKTSATLKLPWYWPTGRWGSLNLAKLSALRTGRL
jgi:hypothetical protein